MSLFSLHFWNSFSVYSFQDWQIFFMTHWKYGFTAFWVNYWLTHLGMCYLSNHFEGDFFFLLLLFLRSFLYLQCFVISVWEWSSFYLYGISWASCFRRFMLYNRSEKFILIFFSSFPFSFLILELWLNISSLSYLLTTLSQVLLPSFLWAAIWIISLDPSSNLFSFQLYLICFINPSSEF